MEFNQWAGGEDDEEIWKIDTLQAAQIGWRFAGEGGELDGCCV